MDSDEEEEEEGEMEEEEAHDEASRSVAPGDDTASRGTAPASRCVRHGLGARALGSGGSEHQLWLMVWGCPLHSRGLDPAKRGGFFDDL
jgi:hypothetical protein